MNTRDTIVGAADWVDILGTDSEAFISNVGHRTVYIREAPSASKPDTSVKYGHPLSQGEAITGSMKNGQTLWARSARGEGVLVVTPK